MKKLYSSHQITVAENIKVLLSAKTFGWKVAKNASLDDNSQDKRPVRW